MTGEWVKGLSSTNRLSQNSHGDITYSIGNIVAEELAHKQWCGDCPRVQGMLGKWGQRGKNQDNFKSIINIYLKNIYF